MPTTVKNASGIHITVEAYADYLVTLVQIDFKNEPRRFVNCRSWVDLHDVCDANEYLIDADAFFGIDYVGSDEQHEFINTAIEIAEKTLFASPSIVTADRTN